MSDSESEGIWGVDLLEDRGVLVPPISVCVQLACKEVTMELDTGSGGFRGGKGGANAPPFGG